MKLLVIISFLFLTTCTYAQMHTGIEIADRIGFVMQGEVKAKFALLQIKTTVSSDPTFQLKGGFRIGNDKLHGVVYLPIFNYSLEQTAYNTPLNFEVRYKITDYWIVGGVEVYSDRPRPYLNLLVNFK